MARILSTWCDDNGHTLYVRFLKSDVFVNECNSSQRLSLFGTLDLSMCRGTYYTERKHGLRTCL